LTVGHIVLIGGGGFIGKTFIQSFAERFERIVVVDRFSGPAHPRPDAYQAFVGDIDSRVITIVGDAMCSDALGGVLSAADAVLLMHADTGTANSLLAPQQCLRENVTATVAVAEAIRKFCRRDRVRIVFTSSRAVYGEGAWSCPVHGHAVLDRTVTALEQKSFEPICRRCGASLDLLGSAEDGRTTPLSVYGASKRSAEHLLSALLSQDGYDLRIVRYQNVFGPGQEITNPYTGVLNWFSTQLVQNQPVEIYERGNIRRDFIFVQDAAQLLLRLATMERCQAGPYIVNGGSGNAVGLLQVAQALRDEYRSNSEIVLSDKFRVGDVLGARADAARATGELSFVCSVPLTEGLRRYARWFEATAAVLAR
jgi:dTDP-L-rhamnose 4-epimerase